MANISFNIVHLNSKVCYVRKYENCKAHVGCLFQHVEKLVSSSLASNILIFRILNHESSEIMKETLLSEFQHIVVNRPNWDSDELTASLSFPAFFILIPSCYGSILLRVMLDRLSGLFAPPQAVYPSLQSPVQTQSRRRA